ncbi:hypothetical protein PCYB_142170 [Plasmodium cynomolgi strain B]|uniref:Uncharacterized protein n=1 Tax=Plasmodium cynomolgi (strain B) TaxID=1120755 RepID=K6UY60_PLACD|nr:hypothetical protein PCYB_142170 [Plasmodium cynomolgi strain B]GAB68789.1 hypothetical protein PCYB_142170 [Plasmodium cynomolgi strain B]
MIIMPKVHKCTTYDTTSGVTPYLLSKKQISYTQHNSRNVNSKNAYLYDLYRSLENCKNASTLVKIKHSKIFELIAKQIPTVKITDDELKSIKRSFDQLGYSCETLDKYIQYRLS